MIVLTTVQRDQVAGIYNKSYEIAPYFIEEGKYALPLEVLNDDNFTSVRELLESCPQEDIILPFYNIPEPEG